MKMILGTAAAVLSIVALAALGALAWQSHTAYSLKAVNAALQEELDHSRQAAASLTGENRVLSEQLDELQESERELRERVGTLEADAEAFATARPQPYQVRAFVGRENVGAAWIIPHNITMDEELGRYVYEPVLVIDESAKEHFTVHHTNVVEREVQTTHVYQEDYGYPYYYYVPYGRPGLPGRPDRPTPPGRPQPSTSTPPAEPGVSIPPNANTRVFAPPNSIVNVRPQVIGTPATPPANQRVFQP